MCHTLLDALQPSVVYWIWRRFGVIQSVVGGSERTVIGGRTRLRCASTEHILGRCLGIAGSKARGRLGFWRRPTRHSTQRRIYRMKNAWKVALECVRGAETSLDQLS